MGGLVDSIFGDGQKTTTSNAIPGMGADEQELLKLQTELSKRQLAQIDQLAPFQQQLLQMSQDDLTRQSALAKAQDAAVTPEQQAAQYKADFERSQKLGPIQDELLQLQLQQARQGGRATPEQLASIKSAADAGIEAGSFDIDASTKRGIGLISDELANSRGLRLSDSPIGSEAALLAREGEIQKGSLIKNLRAGQATAALNYPLAASQVSSGINLSQQSVAQAAQQFQADLRQRAYQNRLALTGQTAQTGIGLSSIGDPSKTLSALSSARIASGTQSQTKGLGLSDLGSLASGAGALALAFSDRRLKRDIVKVGEDSRGFGVYEYSIFGRRERGVMADEVERIIPDAVHTLPSGVQAVNYEMLR